MKNSIILFFLLACSPAIAQDIHFSQFYENAPLRNPALTGIFTGDYKVGVSYRNQWSSFATPFQTTMFNGETKALVGKTTGDFLSFGLSVAMDKAGAIDFNSTLVYGAISFNKNLGDERNTYLSFGLSGGYVQRSMNVAKMKFANQYSNGVYNGGTSSGENIAASKFSSFDIAAGLSLNGSLNPNVNYYIGVGAYHLSQPEQTYLKNEEGELPIRWTGNLGIRATVADGIGLMAVLNYQRQQAHQELIGGLLVSYLVNYDYNGENAGKVRAYVGCLYRLQDAVIPTLRFDYRNCGLTVSYDVSVNNKRIYMSALGGYEISLFVRGRYATPKRLVDDLTSPRFELDEINRNNY